MYSCVDLPVLDQISLQINTLAAFRFPGGAAMCRNSFQSNANVPPLGEVGLFICMIFIEKQNLARELLLQ
jgi:hypothetical protein